MENVYNFVKDWIRVWNSRDISAILSHYADDVEVTSPMIRISGYSDSSTIKGKDEVGRYWKEALKKFPDLNFELIDYASGENCVTIFYISVSDLLAMETLWLDENRKIKKVNVCYRPI